MLKINWFECDLKCYDSVGMEIDIEELPVKIRREIANAIVNGHKCGSFSGEVVDHELMGELHPIFRTQLEAVANMQKTANWVRDTEAAERAKLLSVNGLEEKEESIDA